ncbi:calcium-binding protein 2 [Brachyhypopomus gauderio]|uniref:calcium-binding protein 2 n=1 Tax=Brachyhypopomus gauderio TaxID=698409 RepID=UPI00404278ED
MSAPQERTPKQVQAAIKKKVEKHKKQLEVGVAEVFESSAQSRKAQRYYHSASSERRADEEEEEDEGAVSMTEEQHEMNEDNLASMVESVYGHDRTLQPEEIEDLHQAFKMFDRNKGYISQCDLGECMRCMGYMPTEMELIEMSQQLGGNKIDFDDFVKLVGPKLLEETADMIGIKELRDAFREFDSNDDGQISIFELREAIKKLTGQQLNAMEIDEIIKDVDLNGDGQVDFEEFVRMMSR